jgi:hypothetical protein
LQLPALRSEFHEHEQLVWNQRSKASHRRDAPTGQAEAEDAAGDAVEEN